MRSIFVVLAILILPGCNSSGKKKSNNEPDDSLLVNNQSSDARMNEPIQVSAADIPSTIQLNGNFFEGWKWTDSRGENLLITTIIAPYDDKEKNEFGEEGQSAALHAVLYSRNDGDYRQVWSLSEKVKTCPFDITCEFIKGSISITDLDADGFSETTLLYRQACRSDVSPSVMKLVMYEGDRKYMLKGLSWYGLEGMVFNINEDNANLEKLQGYKGTEGEYEKTFGRYETEKDFEGAPASFISFARKHWVMFVKESFE